MQLPFLLIILFFILLLIIVSTGPELVLESIIKNIKVHSVRAQIHSRLFMFS